jgi:MraZ protein
MWGFPTWDAGGCGIITLILGEIFYGVKHMFWGEYAHQLDSKGRLIIPARYRPYLSQDAVLTRGLDRNLVVYPQDSWKAVSEQLGQMPITHPTARALRRLLFSGAVQLSLDRQGRVSIPTYLRDYASLNGTVLIIGMETFIEIWQPDGWRQTLDDVSSKLAEAENLFNFSV